MPHCDPPEHANIENSHVLYKIRMKNGVSRKLKDRKAPHSNEGRLKYILTSGCITCPPTALQIVESLPSLFGRTLYKVDVKTAFLQTGSADRDVYVKPPRESKIRSAQL